jgi:hypothetical protein
MKLSLPDRSPSLPVPGAAAPVTAPGHDATSGMVKLPQERLDAIEAQAEQLAVAVLHEPVRSEALRKSVEGVHALGTREIREASDLSSRLLERPRRPRS